MMAMMAEHFIGRINQGDTAIALDPDVWNQMHMGIEAPKLLWMIHALTPQDGFTGAAGGHDLAMNWRSGGMRGRQPSAVMAVTFASRK